MKKPPSDHSRRARKNNEESRITDELDMDKAFKEACARFMRLQETVYAKATAKQLSSTETGLTRESRHATLCLKRSKAGCKSSSQGT